MTRPPTRCFNPCARSRGPRPLFWVGALITLAQAGHGCASLQLDLITQGSEKPSNVAVYFKVLDQNGEPVPNLSADSFDIYEDDGLISRFESQQTILNPELAASHFTLLLVDMSGSVTESDDAEAVFEAAAQFTSRVDENQLVAVYAFDGSADVFEVSKFAKGEAAQSRLEGMRGFTAKDPSTNLNGAVVRGLEVLDAAVAGAKTPVSLGTLVVFTDGTDRAARVSAEDMKTAIGESPHSVFAIGLGGEISEKDLQTIGREGTAMAADGEEVGAAFDKIASRIDALTKSYYLLSYCSPARAGTHTVTIEATYDPNNPPARAPSEGGEPTGQGSSGSSGGAGGAKGKQGKRGKKPITGKLTTEFDADGFGPGCDPNTPPKFDVRKGEALRAEEPAAGAKRRK